MLEKKREYAFPQLLLLNVLCEQGYSLSAGFDVPGGGNNGNEEWV